MADGDDPDRLPLPKDWPCHARAAVLNAMSLAASAFVLHLERWANCVLPRARNLAERQLLEAEIATLKEELRIKDARMRKLRPPNRPHYAPPDRMAILELKARRGWSKAEAARRFLVEPATIASWMKRLD